MALAPNRDAKDDAAQRSSSVFFAMSLFALFHIVAGSLALLSGAVALCVRKGRGRHVRWGRVYVCAMIAMSLSGATLAAFDGDVESVLGGSLACYLTTTGWLALRGTSISGRWSSALACCALCVAAAAMALLATSTTVGTFAVGDDAASVAVFGGILGMTGAIDVYRHRRSAIAPVPADDRRRLLRHLWRMTFALLLACIAFFLGQADEFQPALRRMDLLLLPCVAVLFALAYWVLRMRRPFRAAR